MPSPVLEAVLQEEMIDMVRDATVEGLYEKLEDYTFGDDNESPAEQQQQKAEEEQKKKLETEKEQVRQNLAAANLPAVNEDAIRRGLLVGKDPDDIVRTVKRAANQTVKAESSKALEAMRQLARQGDAANIAAVQNAGTIIRSQIDEAVIGEVGVGSEGLSAAQDLQSQAWREQEFTGSSPNASSGPTQQKGGHFSLDKNRKGTRVFNSVKEAA